MTKTELIAAVAEAAEITKKDAEKAVNATVEAITKALADFIKQKGYQATENHRDMTRA